VEEWSSEGTPSGESNSLGVRDGFNSVTMIDGATLKKADRKVYSAVALSMKTSNKDLYIASTGSFYANN